MTPSSTTPTPTPVPTPSPSRLLFLFADGGALADLNDWLRDQHPPRGEGRLIDFLRVPEQVRTVLQVELSREKRPVLLECPREARIFFALGTSGGGSFLEKMGGEWSVETLPLSLCRYERPGSGDTARPLFRVRFHALLAYHLGILTGSLPHASRDFTVGIVADDPHIVPTMADARRRGVDVRLVWFQGALSEEVGFFAAGRQVPTVLLAPPEAPHRDLRRVDHLLGLQ